MLRSISLFFSDVRQTQIVDEGSDEVSGSDGKLYPPMSDLLAAADITVFEGFTSEQLDPAPDLVIVGNANLPRGNEAIEHVLNKGLRYTSGAQWLGDTLKDSLRSFL